MISIIDIGIKSNPGNFSGNFQKNSSCQILCEVVLFPNMEATKRRHVENCRMGHGKRMIMLGKKANPYPYIKSCDIYVQSSRQEGNSFTVHEVQFFYKPVVITKYTTLYSQHEDGIDGVIVGISFMAG